MKPAVKLSYKEQRELEQLPERIEVLDAQVAEIQNTLAAPDFYRDRAEEAAELGRKLGELEAELAQCYERWETLEGS